MKRTFHTECAYILGLIFVAFGVAFMEKSDFGVSMVVAPAYILHLKLVPVWSFFSFGMAEYTLQAFLLLLMTLIIRKFKVSYLFSFVTAVLYGFVLDFSIFCLSNLPAQILWLRIVYYVLGILLGSVGISLFFHTYIAPEVYELFVKEVSSHFHIDINRFKTGYDICSLVVGVLMSFIFFGLWVFKGVRWGTLLCALVNGSIIGLCSRTFEAHFEFKDAFTSFRTFFER